MIVDYLKRQGYTDDDIQLATLLSKLDLDNGTNQLDSYSYE